MVAGLSGAVLLKMLHLLHSDTGHLTMILGKLQGPGTNMTIFLWDNSLKYLLSMSLLFLKNSHTVSVTLGSRVLELTCVCRHMTCRPDSSMGLRLYGDASSEKAPHINGVT